MAEIEKVVEAEILEEEYKKTFCALIDAASWIGQGHWIVGELKRRYSVSQEEIDAVAATYREDSQQMADIMNRVLVKNDAGTCRAGNDSEYDH